MSAGPYNCSVCDDSTLCAQQGLLDSRQGTGDWATNPYTRETFCKLEKHEPAAFVYQILLRLAAKQGVDVSELMRGQA